MNREKLRAELRERRAKLQPAEIAERSLRVKKNLMGLPEFQSARCLGIYLPKPGSGEVDTSLLLDQLGKKRVAVPVVLGKGIMRFSELLDPCELSPGFFGIPEPRPEYRRWVEPGELDLVLVPGICFDLEGRRLGYGQGYYDRFLAELSEANPRSVSAGVAYEFQVVERLPNSPNDRRVDLLVTEERARRVRKR